MLRLSRIRLAAVLFVLNEACDFMLRAEDGPLNLTVKSFYDWNLTKDLFLICSIFCIRLFWNVMLSFRMRMCYGISVFPLTLALRRAIGENLACLFGVSFFKIELSLEGIFCIPIPK